MSKHNCKGGVCTLPRLLNLIPRVRSVSRCRYLVRPEFSTKGILIDTPPSFPFARASRDIKILATENSQRLQRRYDRKPTLGRVILRHGGYRVRKNVSFKQDSATER